MVLNEELTSGDDGDEVDSQEEHGPLKAEHWWKDDLISETLIKGLNKRLKFPLNDIEMQNLTGRIGEHMTSKQIEDVSLSLNEVPHSPAPVRMPPTLLH